MPKQKTQTRQFNVMLSEREHQALRDMSEADGLSAGQIVRMAIRAKVACRDGKPCCGDGTPCLVPQMHIGRG